MRPWLLYVSINDITLSMLACSLFFFSVARLTAFRLSSSRVFFFHYVNELYALRLVENKGVEPLTPSLQS